MGYYKEAFPKASITPKMHMLEHHVIPWLTEWKVGFGLMGEQGAESIHGHFNRLRTTTYFSIPDPVEQLRCMMEDHYLRIAPSMIQSIPQPKRRNLSRNSNT